MDLKRAWHSFRLLTMRTYLKRGEYVRKHKLFHYCGENVGLPRKALPLHPELISIHDNVMIGSGASLVVHDGLHLVLNRMGGSEQKFEENLGCIEIMDNVFIGANAMILGNVKIGPNAVIGAGSVVNRDVAPGTVVAGVPARPIGEFDRLAEKRAKVKRMSASARWAEFEEQKKA